MTKTHVDTTGRTVLDPQVLLLSDDETGESRVLPSLIDLKRQDAWIKTTRAECEAAIKKADDEGAPVDDVDRVAATLKLAHIGRIAEEVAVIRKHRDALVDKAVKLDIRVVKPTYGDVLRAEGNAQHLDPDTGAISVDRRKMLSELVANSIIDGSNERIPLNSLETPVGRYLESFVGRIAFPEEARIPFWSLFSAMS